MAKPSNNNERNLFRDIDLQIMLCNERIKNHRRSIDKIKKMCGWNGPSGVGGIDYSKESSPSTHISFLEGLELIQRDEANIRTLTEERKELRRSKKARAKDLFEPDRLRRKNLLQPRDFERDTAKNRRKNRSVRPPGTADRRGHERPWLDLKMKIF